MQLGQIMDNKIQKDQNPTATSEEPGAKVGCWEQKQGTVHAPWTQHHLSHPSGPTPGPAPTLTPYKEPARPSSGSKQDGNLLFVLSFFFNIFIGL